MKAMEFRDIQDRLVLAALPHVVFEGWSSQALLHAAQEAGLDASLAERAFLAGPVAAVEHFADLGDRLMAEDLAAQDLSALRVSQRVELAVMTRLGRWAGDKEAVRRGLSLLALNPITAARVTARTVDAIWRAAGDGSSDFSWYTRRATLAAVYSATLLYWLDDAGEGDGATRDFLKRRLAGVGKLTGLRRKVEELATQLPGHLPGMARFKRA